MSFIDELKEAILPAKMRLFHQRCLHAELSCPDGRDITARAAADHGEIESRVRHVRVPLSRFRA